ncbi:MAG: recombinase family protein [Bacilli bacterium]|nr:recombinase family protein [Bacilli bacterium]
MNKNIYKVGIYLRLSNEDKDKISIDETSESIKNQRNMLIDYISKHPEFILIDEYCDEDLSGAGTYRPEFERLIKDCENRKIDIVLCKSQSRFSRDMEIVEKYINNKFKEWNIRFIGLSDNADTDIAGNKKARQINGLVNEWYLEDVSNNIRSAFKAKMLNGEFISPFAAFGYEIDKNNNNKLVVDLDAAIIVKEIYNLYLKGLGYTSIAKYLNNKDIPSPSLYKYQRGSKLNVVSSLPRDKIKWNPNAIKNILSNELYIGNLIQGKRTTISYKNHKIKNKDKKEWICTKGAHEAIIDKEIFNKVQTQMRKRNRISINTGKVHLFSGKIFCSECKHSMRKKNSSKHEYLVCHNNDCFNKTSIRYDLLEKIIKDKINNKISKYFNKDVIIGLIKEKNNIDFKNKMSILEKRKNEINNKMTNNKIFIQNLYEDKVKCIINEENFKYLIDIYNKNENTYINQIEEINKNIDILKKNNTIDYEEILNKYKNIKVLNKIIVDEFIDKIFIGNVNDNGRIIQIKWNF